MNELRLFSFFYAIKREDLQERPKQQLKYYFFSLNSYKMNVFPSYTYLLFHCPPGLCLPILLPSVQFV